MDLELSGHVAVVPMYHHDNNVCSIRSPTFTATLYVDIFFYSELYSALSERWTLLCAVHV